MKRDEWTDRQHKKNLEAFKQLAIRIGRGLLKIMSIPIDEPQFGRIRVTIYIKDTEGK
jgi:hypothetical protein